MNENINTFYSQIDVFEFDTNFPDFKTYYEAFGDKIGCIPKNEIPMIEFETAYKLKTMPEDFDYLPF